MFNRNAFSELILGIMIHFYSNSASKEFVICFFHYSKIFHTEILFVKGHELQIN